MEPHFIFNASNACNADSSVNAYEFHITAECFHVLPGYIAIAYDMDYTPLICYWRVYWCYCFPNARKIIAGYDEYIPYSSEFLSTLSTNIWHSLFLLSIDPIHPCCLPGLYYSIYCLFFNRAITTNIVTNLYMWWRRFPSTAGFAIPLHEEALCLLCCLWSVLISHHHISLLCGIGYL